MTQTPLYTPDDPLHREIQELLPWYVNGTLRGAEAARVDAHLAECRYCRDELEQCRALPAAVKDANENTWSPSATHFAELMRRIDATAAVRTQLQGLTARAKDWFAWFGATPSPARWALGLQGALVLMLGVTLLFAPPESKIYETLSNAPLHAVSGPAIFKIMFADDITGKELSGLLQSLNASIIAGPSAIGVYTIQAPGRASSSSAVQTVQALRAHPKVLLAEEISP